MNEEPRRRTAPGSKGVKDAKGGQVYIYDLNLVAFDIFGFR
jgi:hypothetical protein